ncbi:uncharacterized protein LOC110460616 [Mizuhopecten yessoensis]|uniref:uncharacterized protein LOC110460616 n=1 Tax=Mizuhopecten yessoensis TaxID=6573 RepID=UPI000B45EB52|nr:uncharacterized protein LOC110460616 [Mizuhopecten yessoensis]
MALRIQRKPGTVGKSSGDAKGKRQGTPKVADPPPEQEHAYQDFSPGMEVDRVSFMDSKESKTISSDKGRWGNPTGKEGQTVASASTTFTSNSKQVYKGPPAARVFNIRKKELNKRGIKDLEEWVKDPNNIYIGRDMTFYVGGAVGSKWGNPFKKLERDEAVIRFEEHIRASPSLMAELDELKGKNLGCWCHPLSCHGHVLVRLLEEKLAKEQLT